MNRDSKGRYTKKGFIKPLVLASVAGLGIYIALLNVNSTETYTKIETATSTPKVVNAINPFDEIKSRESFKKRVENQAKQVFINEEIAEREAKIDLLQKEIGTLQTDLETTRQEELDLQ